jgi:hypothetical protein
MKKVLLVYLPFCTPASPPYSLTNLHAYLKKYCTVEILDLNLLFHTLKFASYQKYYKDITRWNTYDAITKEYIKESSKIYSENNKKVVKGEKPEYYSLFLNKIKEKKADIAAFSIVYSSQAFYAYALLKELKNAVIGGPAVNDKLAAGKMIQDETLFLEYITGKKMQHTRPALDFSLYNLLEYFTPTPVIPLKTSSTCYYQRCTFCTHFCRVPYEEYALDTIRKTIIDSGQKYFFLIDDMIPAKRLLQIAEVFKPLDIHWTCQLRPTAELDFPTLKKLRESGLTIIMWGVESGNDRILKLINKGTKVSCMEQVISDSHNAGIKNVAYMLFGFPGETKPEFLDTIGFLERNKENIDLVSSSIFGLQKGTVIYNNPAKFGITKITETERTVLEPRISYELSSGLTQEEATKMRYRYTRTFENINKYPKSMNFFREHMFCLI